MKKRKGKGGENGREGRGRGHRDGRESLWVKGGEGKWIGKRGGEGRENLGGPGPSQILFPRTAPAATVLARALCLYQL